MLSLFSVFAFVLLSDSSVPYLAYMSGVGLLCVARKGWRPEVCSFGSPGSNQIFHRGKTRPPFPGEACFWKEDWMKRQRGGERLRDSMENTLNSWHPAPHSLVSLTNGEELRHKTLHLLPLFFFLKQHLGTQNETHESHFRLLKSNCQVDVKAVYVCVCPAHMLCTCVFINPDNPC